MWTSDRPGDVLLPGDTGSVTFKDELQTLQSEQLDLRVQKKKKTYNKKMNTLKTLMPHVHFCTIYFRAAREGMSGMSVIARLR